MPYIMSCGSNLTWSRSLARLSSSLCKLVLCTLWSMSTCRRESGDGRGWLRQTVPSRQREIVLKVRMHRGTVEETIIAGSTAALNSNVGRQDEQKRNRCRRPGRSDAIRRFQFRVLFFPSAARNGNRARLTPREGPDRLEIDLPHFAILVGSAFWSSSLSLNLFASARDTC